MENREIKNIIYDVLNIYGIEFKHWECPFVMNLFVDNLPCFGYEDCPWREDSSKEGLCWDIVFDALIEEKRNKE